MLFMYDSCVSSLSFASFVNHTIPQSVITTIAGTGLYGNSGDGEAATNAQLNQPYGVAVDSAGNLYVSEFAGCTIRKMTPVGTNWAITTLAGTAGEIGSADGTGNRARFWSPGGLAVDNTGSIYAPDIGNHTIRRVTPVGTNWVVTTIAGMASVAASADGTNRAARFRWPKAARNNNMSNWSLLLNPNGPRLRLWLIPRWLSGYDSSTDPWQV